jgi:hypothetical protein
VPQPKELGANISLVVVAYLIQQIPKAGYILYLDNLFTNIKLLIYLRKLGIEVISTCISKSNILKEFALKKKLDKKRNKIL